MGYGIRGAQQFHEACVHVIRGRCACGAVIDVREEVVGPAGHIGLVGLAERAHACAARACSSCGASFADSGVQVAAIQPIITTRLWVAVGVRADEGWTVAIGADEDRLLDDLARATSALELSELALAGRAGAPLSLAGAWNEAMMAMALGAPEVFFPAGPGCACLLARDRDHAQEVATCVGLAGELHVLPQRFSRAWPHPTPAPVPAVVISRARLREEIRLEAATCGLRVLVAPDGIRIGREGVPMWYPLDEDALISASLSNGRLPRLEAGAMLLRARHTLRERQRAIGDVIATMRPRSWRVEREGATLALYLRDRRIAVDLEQLVRLPDAQRTRYLEDLVAGER